MLHGNPTWSFQFRHLIRALRREALQAPADGPPMRPVSNSTSMPSGSCSVVVSMGMNPMIVRSGSSGAAMSSTEPVSSVPSRCTVTSTTSPGSCDVMSGLSSGRVSTVVPSIDTMTSFGCRKSFDGG